MVTNLVGVVRWASADEPAISRWSISQRCLHNFPRSQANGGWCRQRHHKVIARSSGTKGASCMAGHARALGAEFRAAQSLNMYGINRNVLTAVWLAVARDTISDVFGS